MSPVVVYLASRSPRREELLRQLGVGFERLLMREAPGRPSDVTEATRDGEPALHYVERIARTKATVGWQRMLRRGLPSRPVLGADTEVVVEGAIFGKPADAADAMRMLELLSGRTHEVISGIAVRWEDGIEASLSTSRVAFRPLTRAEIERYVASGEPFGKAGAYAIQGRAAAFATRIEGSYSGIMGLPLYETAEVLARIGVPVL